MSKNRAIPKEELELRKLLAKCWKELKFDSKKMLNWMFFYRPKDSGDKIFHLIEVFCVIVVLVRLVGR